MPARFVALFLEEGDVRQDEVDARQVRPGEGDAAIDDDPVAVVRRPEAVEAQIHADLADAAERHEDQFGLARCGIMPLPPRRRNARRRR